MSNFPFLKVHKAPLAQCFKTLFRVTKPKT